MFHIESAESGGLPVRIELEGQQTVTADSDYEVLYYFEKMMTIALEELRSDLYFLHAGALEYGGTACILVAESGAGKSTTTWALLHNGFRYLSDELAPVDLESLEVMPYPHALCLKSDPPAPFHLPEETLRTRHTLHVPVERLPGNFLRTSVPLSAAFFISYRPDAPAPSVRPISQGETTARIYANGLNQLAHQHYGMEAAARIGTGIAGFEMVTADLRKSAELMRDTMRRELPGRS